jgi:hypothetical protein
VDRYITGHRQRRPALATDPCTSKAASLSWRLVHRVLETTLVTGERLVDYP